MKISDTSSGSTQHYRGFYQGCLEHWTEGLPPNPANQRAAVRQSGQSAADKTQYLTRWSHSINDRASTRELLLPLLPTNGHCAPKFPILAKFIVGLKQKHLLVGVMLRPRHFKSKNLYKKTKCGHCCELWQPFREASQPEHSFTF